MAQTPAQTAHRKFIAFIVAASVAITGFSAAPARADEDVAKFIAGMALLGILGAAINDARKEDRVAAQPHYPHQPHHPGGQVRPLPPKLHKYNLPAKCMQYFPRYSSKYPLAANACLKRSYGSTRALPRACRVRVWDGRHHRIGFKPSCLRKHGYRMVTR